jgi:hypothetical protein
MLSILPKRRTRDYSFSENVVGHISRMKLVLPDTKLRSDPYSSMGLQFGAVFLAISRLRLKAFREEV